MSVLQETFEAQTQPLPSTFTPSPRLDPSTNRLRSSTIVFVAILLAALAIRLIWLDRIPTNLTADETDNLRTVFSIEELGKPRFFGLDWKPAPAFSMYVAREFMRVFGDTPVGLRMPSVVMSVLALLPFFALARRVVAPPAALGAAALLASGRWYLHFSRSGWENVQVAFYALLAAWALTIALEKGSLRWFALAGIGGALGLYGYFAGRFILPAMLAYAPVAWLLLHLRRRALTSPEIVTWPAREIDVIEPGPRRLRTIVLGFAIVALVALALYIPEIRTIQRNWDSFNRRVNVVSIFNQPKPYLGETSNLAILELQVKRTLSGFIGLDHALINNGRYSPPDKAILDPATSLLFLIGLGLSLAKWKRTALWWCFLFVPLIGTQVFTSNTPDGARAVMVAPFFYLFVALSLDAFIGLAPQRRRSILTGVTAVVVAVICAFNIVSYLNWIQSDNAAEVRGPSVSYADYDKWETSVRCELRGTTLDEKSAAPYRCIPPQP